jgi:hypothetical protein
MTDLVADALSLPKDEPTTRQLEQRAHSATRLLRTDFSWLHHIGVGFNRYCSIGTMSQSQLQWLEKGRAMRWKPGENKVPATLVPEMARIYGCKTPMLVYNGRQISRIQRLYIAALCITVHIDK